MSRDLNRRRRVVAATSVAGAGLLGVSLSSEPDSRRFYVLTAGVAATWIAGGFASGPLHLGYEPTLAPPVQPVAPVVPQSRRRPVVAPIATGVAAFAGFYVGARVARRIPVLNEAITGVLRYAHRGSDSLVLATTLANGVAEEVFFRGALFDAVGGARAIPVSTGVYMAATAATRNPALVLASGVMGALFALQRRATGGVQAPILTHVTWSTLMLRYLPPLFRDNGPGRITGRR